MSAYQDDLDKGERLLHLCHEFIKAQNITCAETVYQSDRVIVNAYEFIESLCDVAGYAKCDDEENDEEVAF